MPPIYNTNLGWCSRWIYGVLTMGDFTVYKKQRNKNKDNMTDKYTGMGPNTKWSLYVYLYTSIVQMSPQNNLSGLN